MSVLDHLPKHKATWKHVFRYGVQAALAYVMLGIFKCMPASVAANCGGAVMRTIGPHLKISRRVVLRNLDIAFPEKSPAEKVQIMRGMWNNLGRVIAEYAHLPTVAQQTEIIGAHYFDTIKAAGKSAIFLGGHIGNWEIGSAVGMIHNMPVKVVYRTPNNPWVDDLLRRARGELATGMIRKGHAGAREIMAAIKGGHHIGMLLDQKLNEGMAVSLFGRDAMTAPAVAYFALKFGCPLHPLRIERLESGRYRMTIYPPMPVIDTGDKEADSRAILQSINHLLESWIRERPEQWLWTHRRFPKEIYRK